MSERIILTAGDLLQLRKPHPCGCSVFRVARAGADVRLICTGCGRDMTFDRLKAESMVRKIISEPGGKL